MLSGVKAHQLFFLRHPQSDGRPDDGKCDEDRHNCPGCGDEHAAELLAELHKAAAIEQTFANPCHSKARCT